MSKKFQKALNFILAIIIVGFFSYFAYIGAHFDDDKACWSNGGEYIQKDPNDSFSWYCDFSKVKN